MKVCCVCLVCFYCIFIYLENVSGGRCLSLCHFNNSLCRTLDDGATSCSCQEGYININDICQRMFGYLLFDKEIILLNYFPASATVAPTFAPTPTSN